MAKELKKDTLVMKESITFGGKNYLVGTEPPDNLISEFKEKGWLKPLAEVEKLLKPAHSDLEQKAKYLEQENLDLKAKVKRKADLIVELNTQIAKIEDETKNLKKPKVIKEPESKADKPKKKK